MGKRICFKIAKHAFVYKEQGYSYRVGIESEGTLYIMNFTCSAELALSIAKEINDTKLFNRDHFATIAELFSKYKNNC